MSTARDLERLFLGKITGWLLSLPHDLKVLFEAKDDPNLDRAARETAAGAILYVLNPDKVASLGVPNEEPFVGFADDAVLLRAALARVATQGGEGSDAFRERFDEYYTSINEDLDLCQQAMGDVYTWLSHKVDALPKQTYKGKKVPQYIDDDEEAELLYEDGLAFATDYPLDEDKLGMRLKRPETLLEPLRHRVAEEKKRIAQSA